MTYCFAWKYQDAVFLIADTLVTQSVPAGRPATSMAEPHRQLSRGEFVEERLLKIRELKEGIAVAIAGDVRFAFEITDFMREHIEDVETTADLFLMVEASFGPFDPARYVQILVVEAVEHGACTITKWDTQGVREDALRCAFIGSLAQRYSDVIAGLVLRLQADQPSKEAMLCSGIALVELLSQGEDLIAQNVGGVVCGLRVQRNQTIWPDDLITVLYKDDHSLDGMISVHMREGNLCINSTYHGTEGSVFVNKSATAHTIGEMHVWGERWLPYLKDYLSEHFVTCNRWLFINRDRLVTVVFLVHARLEQANRHLRITKSDAGTVNFEFGPGLADALWRESPICPSLRIIETIDFAAALPDGINRAH